MLNEARNTIWTHFVLGTVHKSLKTYCAIEKRALLL